MTTAKSDSERILEAVQDLRKRIEELFILHASLAGIGQQEIRKMLGIDLNRVTRVARYAKKEGKQNS